MNIAQYRKESFQPFTQFQATELEIENFAKAGFYYTLKGKTCCFLCNLKKSDWKQDQSPFDVHAYLCPDCPWVKLGFPGTLPTSTLEYTVAEKRPTQQACLATFKRHDFWQVGSISPSKLSKAGFFYAPTEDYPMRIQCPYCLVTIEKPEEEMNFLKEHEYLSSSCSLFDDSNESQSKKRKQDPIDDDIWNIETTFGPSKQPKITFSKRNRKSHHQSYLVDSAEVDFNNLISNTTLFKDIKDDGEEDDNVEEVKNPEPKEAKAKIIKNKINLIESTPIRIRTRQQRRQQQQQQQQQRQQEDEQGFNNKTDTVKASSSSSSSRVITLDDYSPMDQIQQEEDNIYKKSRKNKTISQFEHEDDGYEVVKKLMKETENKGRVTNRETIKNTKTIAKGIVAKLANKDDNIVMGNTTMKRTVTTNKNDKVGVVKTGDVIQEESKVESIFIDDDKLGKSKVAKGKTRSLESEKPPASGKRVFNLSRRKKETTNDSLQQSQQQNKATTPYSSNKNEIPKHNNTTQNNSDPHFKDINCIAVVISCRKDNNNNPNSYAQIQVIADKNGKVTTTENAFSMNWPFSGGI